MSATVPVRHGEELPSEALQKFLYERGLAVNPAFELKISQFPGGYSNLTYQLEWEGRKVVLRKPPKGAMGKKGHDMGREYSVLSGLYPLFNKIPQPLVFTDDDNVIGAPFFLMEKVDGIIIRLQEATKRRIGTSEFEIIANAWLSTLIELHQVNWQSDCLKDLGNPEGYVDRQIQTWTKQYLKAKTEEVPVADKVMKWLANHQPDKYDYCLIHNDYKYDNIIFDPESWNNVKAVLDWEMATLGDPLMDLGTSLGYWLEPSDPPLLLKGMNIATILPGNPVRAAIADAYCYQTGRSAKNLPFYYAFGLFKIAVIAQQIYFRYKKGYTSDVRFEFLGKGAATLIQRAWEVIQSKKI